MGKKKKEKSLKYAKIGGDENGNKSKKQWSNNRASSQRDTPRRSKRTRHSLGTCNTDDFHFRREVEGMISGAFYAAFFTTCIFISHFFRCTVRRPKNNHQYRGRWQLSVWIII
jgi:hypothetical protein